MANSSAAHRKKLVGLLEKEKSIESELVKRAFRAVPRELFVPDHARKGGLEAVYRNEVIVTKTDPKGRATSSSSQPSIMAIMLDALDLRRGHNVLEVGAGTGYNAALMAKIVGAGGRVTAIEIDPELATRARSALRRAGVAARVLAGDGFAGASKWGPFDRIIVTASTSTIPKPWWDQLVPGGLLEVPFVLLDGHDGWLAQRVIVFERTEQGFRSVRQNPGGFMGMRGSASDAAPAMGIASIGAYTTADGQKARYALNLAGRTLRGLRRDEAKQLVRLLLGEPREEGITGRTRSEALQVFLSLALPRERLVMFTSERRAGVGVLSDGLGGVAVAARRHRGSTQLIAFGARSAERMLRAAIQDWHQAGRPGDRDLEIVVSFDRRPDTWRVLRRRGCYVGLGWRTSRANRSSERGSR